MSGTRPERRAKAEAAAGPGLFEVEPGAGIGDQRRHARAVRRAVKAGYADGTLDSTSEAIVTVLDALAWSLDEAEHRNMPYAPAKTAVAAVDVLREMRMTPAARMADDDDDAIGDLFAALSAPTAAGADE